MFCSCTHRNCHFIFFMKGNKLPERCPDCGKKEVRAATPEEIAWFCLEHKATAAAS